MTCFIPCKPGRTPAPGACCCSGSDVIDVESPPATVDLRAVDLRALHGTVMSVVRTMFTANLINATQQQAAIRVVSETHDLLHNQSLIILGYDPKKVNLNQTQVLALLASSKSANNMTAAQSEQIAQLASDTHVRIVQDLVWLLGLTPAQLNLTQANFTAVMALPTFATRPASLSFSTTSSNTKIDEYE